MERRRQPVEPAGAGARATVPLYMTRDYSAKREPTTWLAGDAPGLCIVSVDFAVGGRSVANNATSNLPLGSINDWRAETRTVVLIELLRSACIIGR
jgi:hypothetical protein